MTDTKQICPVVGTTNTILPPSHPPVDLERPGQVCPVTKATTDHHHNLSKHPSIATADDDHNAESCPALAKIVSRPEQQALDEAVCPVVGTVSSVLPPDHPSLADKADDDVCPVTNACLRHHRHKIHRHPKLENADPGAVCPVVGKGPGDE